MAKTLKKIPKVAGLNYDDDTHRYFYRGEPVISVTQGLGRYRRVKHGYIVFIVDTYKGVMFPAEDWEGAADYGTAVHLACEHILCGKKLDMGALDERIRYAVETFPEFMEEYRIQPIATEVAVYHRKFRYAGRVDSVAKVLGKVAVCDIKTGSVIEGVGPQLAGYTDAIRDMTGYTGNIDNYVWLPPKGGKGKWKIKKINEEKKNLSFFRACVTREQAIIEHGYREL